MQTMIISGLDRLVFNKRKIVLTVMTGKVHFATSGLICVPYSLEFTAGKLGFERLSIYGSGK